VQGRVPTISIEICPLRHHSHTAPLAACHANIRTSADGSGECLRGGGSGTFQGATHRAMIIRRTWCAHEQRRGGDERCGAIVRARARGIQLYGRNVRTAVTAGPYAQGKGVWHIHDTYTHTCARQDPVPGVARNSQTEYSNAHRLADLPYNIVNSRTESGIRYKSAIRKGPGRGGAMYPGAHNYPPGPRQAASAIGHESVRVVGLWTMLEAQCWTVDAGP
jgi:hypothetical protein